MLSIREEIIQAIKERNSIEAIEELLSQYSLERYEDGWEDCRDNDWRAKEEDR